MVKTVCTSGKFIAKLLNYIKLLDSYGLLISWSQKNNFFFESKITSHVHMFYFYKRHFQAKSMLQVKSDFS